MLHLEPITWDNFWEVIELEVSTDQKSYLPEVAVYMAQSYVNLSLDYVDQCLAIYDNAKLIGFTKIVFVPKNIKPYHMDTDSFMIDAFMIDLSYQGQGYGRKSLSLIIDNIKKRYEMGEEFITLTCFEKNENAKKLFQSFGFQRIGVKDESKGLYIYGNRNK